MSHRRAQLVVRLGAEKPCGGDGNGLVKITTKVEELVHRAPGKAGKHPKEAGAECRRGTRVTLLIDNMHIRVISRDTGQLIRELTLDPTRDYQPRGVPPGPSPGTLCRPPGAAPDHGPTAAPAGVKAGRRPPAGQRP